MQRIPRSDRSVNSGMQGRLIQLVRWSAKTGCQGQDLIEYALMAGFVAVAVAVAFVGVVIAGGLSVAWWQGRRRTLKAVNFGVEQVEESL